MKSRRRRYHIWIFLLPSLALAIANAGADGKPDRSLSEQKAAGQDENRASVVLDAPSLTTTAKIKADIGTKDAPVDGMDGKPHAGPWVEAGSDRDKPKGKTDDEKKGAPSGKKPSPRPITGSAIPEVNDGVMDDPNREGPRKGMTGTEGGVSEKTKDQKALEGKTGEKKEKKPDPPKEAPPLPHSEEEKIREIVGGPGDEVERGKDGITGTEDMEALKEPGGLAVSTPVHIPIPVTVSAKRSF